MAEHEPTTAPSERLKVFVSYSRTDLDFADQLVFALEDKGFEALVDRHDIDAAENWKERLGALIAESDTVVFVLSEKSAGSPICLWEVEEAARLNKRIIPVVPHDPAGVAPPPQLGELNYIHFFKHPNVPSSGFYDGVRKLDRALRVNLGWLRRQTALAEQAALWAHDKSDDRLLGGKPLEEALTWRVSAPAGSAVSPLVLEYLASGEALAARRKAEANANIAEREAALTRARRATIIGGIVAVVLIAAGTAATIWVGDYSRRAEQAVANSRTEETLRFYRAFFVSEDMQRVRQLLDNEDWCSRYAYVTSDPDNPSLVTAEHVVTTVDFFDAVNACAGRGACNRALVNELFRPYAVDWYDNFSKTILDQRQSGRGERFGAGMAELAREDAPLSDVASRYARESCGAAPP